MAVVLTEVGTASGATTAIVVTLGAVTANIGDTIFAFSANNSATVLTNAAITDTGGNVWNRSSTSGLFNTSASRTAVWYCTVKTALVAGNTVTLTSTAVDKTFQLLVTSGLAKSSTDVEVTSNNQVAVTTIASGTTAATTQIDELVFIIYGYLSNPVFTPPAGYTQPSTTSISSGTVISHAVVYKETSVKGTQTGAATISPAQNATGQIVTAFVKLPTAINNYESVKVGDGMSTGEKIR